MEFEVEYLNLLIDLGKLTLKLHAHLTVNKTELLRAKNSTISSILMNLESRVSEMFLGCL